MDRRPPIVALIRQGDPAAALVLAIGNQQRADSIAQLAALMSTRLGTLPHPIEIRPYIGGLTLSVALSSAAEARPFVSKFDEAWRTRVVRSELNDSLFRKHLLRWQSEVWRALSSPERAACLDDNATEHANETDVEELRLQAFSELSARWGVVGSSEVVEEVRKSVRGTAPWPRIALKNSRWPEQDRATFVVGRERSARIEMAWRVPFASTAIAAGRELQLASSLLAEALDGLPTPWRIERVSATPLPVGGCLALSIIPTDQSAAPTVDETIQAASIVTQTLRRSSPEYQEAAITAPTVAEQADPRRAAELAALSALSSDTASSTDRFRLELDNGSERPVSSLSSEQSEALARAATARSTAPAISLALTTERGQGVLRALVASSCAAWSETSQNVGATALLLRILAARHRDAGEVQIEPWIHANGIGLVGQARRLSPDESPQQQATRLGNALGRTLALLRVDSNYVWRMRSELLARLGPGPRPALWRALASLSPQYPGLIMPEGSFSSLAAVSPLELSERRAQLLRTPMRLAVIQTDSQSQGETVKQALTRWLSLQGSTPVRCPALDGMVPLRPEEIRIESRQTDPEDAAATIALALPTDRPSDTVHAELLLRLLNHPNGWLLRRARENKVVATIAAQVVGGTRRTGLVVAIGATPSSTDAAVAAVRGLFRDLATAALPSPFDYAAVTRELRWSILEKRMDPRVRLEELWLSSGQTIVGDEASFRDYLRRAFSNSNLVTVRLQRSASDSAPNGRTKH